MESSAPRRKIALATGIKGQHSSCLTEFLLQKGYGVHGLIRRSSNFNTHRLNHIYIDPHNSYKALMKFHYASLTDASSLRRWIDSQSHVAVSFEIPDYTADVVATDPLRLLEALRSHVAATGRSHVRYYQAGSSEMFGSTPPPQVRILPLPPPLPLRRRQVRRPLVHRQLQRGLQPLRLQRHPLQPREPPPRRELRHRQDHPRRRPHQDLSLQFTATTRRSVLTLKSDPLKARFDQIHEQANDHRTLVNAYAAYARKLKLENSKQLRIFADLARNFSDLLSRSAYRQFSALDGPPIDEWALRQLEKELKERIKAVR